MNKKDVAKLLRGRKIVDAYRAEHAKGGEDKSAKLTEDIKALGFESIEEFFRLNDAMCMQAIREIPIYGECDFCEGYKGKPRCQVWFGRDGCAATKARPNKEDMYAAILVKTRAGAADFIYEYSAGRLAYLKKGVDKNTGIYWYCTKGHGFYCKPLEVSSEDPLLDIRWR